LRNTAVCAKSPACSGKIQALGSLSTIRSAKLGKYL
jgi:hypothetical protein